MLGKLRIRLSTLQPWAEVEARLPMLADRDKGGSKVAYAHVTLKVRQVPGVAHIVLSRLSCLSFATDLQYCHSSHACKVVALAQQLLMVWGSRRAYSQELWESFCALLCILHTLLKNTETSHTFRLGIELQK